MLHPDLGKVLPSSNSQMPGATATHGAEPASPPQAGEATRGGVERAERKEGRRPPISIGGMGRYQGSFWCSLAQQCYSTGKGAASVGTRLMAAAEHTLPY